MISIKKDSKIYILSPYHNTGGPKSLHQLANVLNSRGYNTFIVYTVKDKILKDRPVLYSFCEAKVSNYIENNKNNYLIVPETYTYFSSKYNDVTTIIWWLSLDFYFTINLIESATNIIKQRGYNLFLYPLIIIGLIIKESNYLVHKKKLSNKDYERIYHLYNCKYVKNYLLSKGALESNISYLCGPLESKFYKINYDEVKDSKKNIVVYNPAKMNLKFFNRIKKITNSNQQEISFLAIENMSRIEVFNALKSAKVYLDFGNFPGPERMPREAVCLYCNIITSTMGSAGNDEDVLIPRKYKFDIIEKSSAKDISRLIIEFVHNYENYISNFDEYREKVWNQIDDFQSDIEEIFIQSEFD